MAGQARFGVLYVEDDPQQGIFVSEMLAAAGFEPIVASSVDEGLAALRRHHQNLALVLSDFRMPGADGLQLRRAMLPEFRHIPFLIISGYVNREMALTAVDLKIAGFLQKPVPPADLVEVVRRESRDRVAALQEQLTLRTTFLAEAVGLLEEAEEQILALEADPANVQAVNALFRLVHTVKGSCHVLEDAALATFAHGYEDLISVLKSGSKIVDRAAISGLLQGLDHVRNLIHDHQQGIPDPGSRPDPVPLLAAVTQTFHAGDVDGAGKTAPGRPATSPAAGAGSGAGSGSGGDTDQVRQAARRDNLQVPAVMLNEVMALGGEITVIRNMVNKTVRALEKQVGLTREIASLAELLEEMHKVNGQIQARIVEMRKVPLGTILKPLWRTVRDLGVNLGKEVQLKITGEALRVDTTLGQTLSSSLTHLLRNAVDHGLEAPSARTAAGKPAAGTIRLDCVESRDSVTVTMADDGRGLDLERIRSKAVERGLYTAAEAARLSPRQTMELIFESGFSTAREVTAVSGRGVGMDMVRAAVVAVGGTIDIDSQPGRGTTFTLSLPIPRSVLIINSLLVQVAGQTFAIPQTQIARVMCLDGETAARRMAGVGRQRANVLRTETGILPLLRLRSLLTAGGPPAAQAGSGDGTVSVVVVSAMEQEIALEVDAILDAEEVVVKPLHQALDQLQVFAGATFMGDGAVGLILDVEGLAKHAELRPEAGSRHGAVDVAPAEAPAGLKEYVTLRLPAAGRYVMSLEDVFRIERVQASAIETLGNRRAMVFRDTVVPVIDVVATLGLSPVPEASHGAGRPDGGDPAGSIRDLVVVERGGAWVALLVGAVDDIIHGPEAVQAVGEESQGIKGGMIADDRTYTVIDADGLIRAAGLAHLLTAAATAVAGKPGQASDNRSPPAEPAPALAAAVHPPAESAPAPAVAVGGEGWGLF